MVTGISVGSGVLTLVSVAIFLVPWEKKRILRQDVEVDETTFHEISISETEICMQDLKGERQFDIEKVWFLPLYYMHLNKHAARNFREQDWLAEFCDK